MAKYRVVRKVKGISSPSSVWLDKPTDEAAILAATALLGRGDSAEIWGERQLIKCVQRRPIPTGSGPRAREVLAGVIMTCSVALIFMAVHNDWLNSIADPVRQPVQAIDTSQPPGVGYAILLDNAPTRAREPDVPAEAAAQPSGQLAASGVKQAQRTRNNQPRLASTPPAARTALFAADPRPRVDIYGLMGGGFAQGGN